MGTKISLTQTPKSQIQPKAAITKYQQPRTRLMQHTDNEKHQEETNSNQFFLRQTFVSAGNKSMPNPTKTKQPGTLGNRKLTKNWHLTFNNHKENTETCVDVRKCEAHIRDEMCVCVITYFLLLNIQVVSFLLGTFIATNVIPFIL